MTTPAPEQQADRPEGSDLRFTHRTRAAFWALAGREAVAQLDDEHQREALALERSAQVRARVSGQSWPVNAAGHQHAPDVTYVQPNERERGHTMSRDKTCADRIAEQQKDREDTLAALYAVADGTAETDDDGNVEVDGEALSRDDAIERLDEIPLAVSTFTTLRIDISTGGPADYLTAKLDGRDVQSVQYHFADWYDHAEQDVDESSPLWRLAEYYAEVVDLHDDRS